MRRLTIFAFAVPLLAAALPAAAFPRPDSNPAFPTENQLASQYAEAAPHPYAMNYAEEAARTLGVKEGRWEAFNTKSSDPLMPSLKGGVDNGGAMIHLQWRSGE